MATKPRPAAVDRRKQIEEIATRAFCKLGYAGASMRDIARELKTTQAAVYYHFGAKEEILYSIINAFTEDLLVMLRAQFESSKDPALSLRRALLAHILLLETRSLETRLVIEEKRSLQSANKRRIVAREREVFALYRDRVTSLVSGKRARAFDPAVATFALLGVVNYFLHWYRPTGQLRLREAAEQSIDLMLGGLLIPQAGRLREKRSTAEPAANRSAL
ncbi:MAG: TetR/AcrR family transcriptional regulator [Burkholderiaceae bacterium]|nr:TetR/AcrR family transcriptional regulator [Burkholderiaceae bacterium]